MWGGSIMQVQVFARVILVSLFLCVFCVSAQAPFMNGSQSVASNAPAASGLSMSAGFILPSQLNSSHLGQVVTIQGSVQKYEPAWNERVPHAMYIQDSTARGVRVVFWKVVADALGPERIPKPGEILKITGQVSEFRNQLQIMGTRVEDIVSLTAHHGKAENYDPIHSLASRQLGDKVKIRGKVEHIRPSWKPTAPYIVTINDGTGTVKVVYWSNVAKSVPENNKPVEGAIITCEGWVDEYRDEVQIKIDNPFKIARAENKPSLSTPNNLPGISVSQARPSPTMSIQPSAQQEDTVFTKMLQPLEPPSLTGGDQAPGFYPIDKAQPIIAGPPTQSHVLFFTADIDLTSGQNYYPPDPQILQVTAEAIFVWVDIHESSHIAEQLGVTSTPTWIFYDSNGIERTRAIGQLNADQIRQKLALIR